MLEEFTVDTFAPLVGHVFDMHMDTTNHLELELTEVAPAGGASSAGAGQARQPFSLSFRGPRTPVMPQRIYPLEHRTLGSFALFLVPIGPDGRGMLYEAIFT